MCLCEIIFISNHKEPFTLLKKIQGSRTGLSAVQWGRRGLCSGIGGASTAGRWLGNSWACPCPPSSAACPLALALPVGTMNGKQHSPPGLSKVQPHHLPMAHLVLCPFSPQVKSHSLRWTFKGPANERSCLRPQRPLLGEATPARPYASDHLGQAGRGGQPPQPPSSLTRAPAPPSSWTPAHTSMCSPTLQELVPGGQVTSGASRSPGSGKWTRRRRLLNGPSVSPRPPLFWGSTHAPPPHPPT